MKIEDSKILIVDDETANVLLLERVVEKWGFANIRSTCDPRDAITLFLEFEPDIILLDLMMPYLDGFELMKRLGALCPDKLRCPILVLTADISSETKHKALASGAKDFLTKPLDPAEVILRIRNLLESHHFQRLLHNHNQSLEEEVLQRTQELEEAQVEVLERLAQAAEYRDDDTGQHTYRVGVITFRLAQELQFSEKQLKLIRRAAPLHDVGKIGISDLLLLKRGKLSDEEFEIMKTHTNIGAKILANGRSELTKMAESIAFTHHERWDGAGYPCGLMGEQIPIEGRMVAIADVYDALTHDRPYKTAWTVEDSVAEIKKQSGQQFDPRVVRTFLRLHEKGLLQVSGAYSRVLSEAPESYWNELSL